MSVFDDLRAKADVNGDGKITKDDLEAIKDKLPEGKLEELKEKADTNDDGKIDMNDLKSFDFGDLLDDAKDMLGGVFGKK